MPRMAVTRDEVRRIADLARIGLADSELDGLARDMAVILTYVAELERVDVEGVEPTTNPTDVTMRLREDVPTPSLPRDRTVAAAPEPLAGGFGVPKVIE